MNQPADSRPESVWDLPAGLTESAWFRDWDYYISSFTSVQKYWSDWQTWPLWNFHFCGGRPELANPQNWTLTWLHPFIYLMQPVHLIVLLWCLLTLTGMAATAWLVRRETGSLLAAGLAGSVYSLSGYFGAHFNQGVFTFAFFHLVPVMMALLIRRFERPTLQNSIGLFAVSLMFFTAALPHGLFYFYPALLLMAAVLFAGEVRASFGGALRRLTVAVYPHVFAAGVALYKLIPVAAWQQMHPRVGVHDESLYPTQMFANLLRIDSDYDNMMAQAFDGQFWFLWEYNAYIGLMPVAAALFALLYFRRDLQTLRRFAYPGLLILCGVLLAGGNEHWSAPGYWFRHLPLVNGIRVFGRFQVLIIFGIALLSGFGFRGMIDLAARQVKLRSGIIALIAGLTLVPLLLQNALHVKTVRGVTFASLDGLYQPPADTAASKLPLLVAMQGNFVKTGITHHDYLIRRGGIVANCYDPLTLERPPVPFTEMERWVALSAPPPAGVKLSPLAMALSYQDAGVGPVTLYLTNGTPPVTVTDQRPVSGDVVVAAAIPGLSAGMGAAFVSLLLYAWVELFRRRRL
jgi:hypothetical protein